MNNETAPQVTEQSAPVVASVAQTATIDQLQAQVAALTIQLNAKDSIVKVPVTDAELDAALGQLETINRESIESESPTAKPTMGLTKVMGKTPDFTKDQKVKWRKFRAGWDKLFSARHRVLLPQRKAMFARVSRNPSAMVGTVAKTRKDSTMSRITLTASEPAKARKGKGLKKAKPSQVAARLPKAGNASPMATIQ